MKQNIIHILLLAAILLLPLAVSAQPKSGGLKIPPKKTSTTKPRTRPTFGQMMQHAKWSTIYNEQYPFKYPSFMKKHEFFLDAEAISFDEFIYQDVTLSYVPLLVSAYVICGENEECYPCEGLVISSKERVDRVTMKTNKITSGYTKSGKIFYTKMNIYKGGEVIHGTALTIIYPKQWQQAVTPIINMIKDW